jgi:hypothetical protein
MNDVVRCHVPRLKNVDQFRLDCGKSFLSVPEHNMFHDPCATTQSFQELCDYAHNSPAKKAICKQQGCSARTLAQGGTQE